MKILFIITQSEFGGAQRYIFELTKNLDKEQYDILVGAGQGDGELFNKLREVGVETMELKQMKRSPLPWQMILSVKEIVGLLRKERPDVLFLCSTTAGLLGSLARLFCKTKVVYRIGGWAFRDPRAFWKNWLVLIAEKITGRLKDLIIVNSEIDYKLALKYKITKPEKLVKIYNGVDKDSLIFLSREEARKKLSLNNEIVVGTVANFYRTKGLEYLIKAARQVETKFIIIGDGTLRPELENLIKKNNLGDKIVLAGRIPNAHQYLKAFDVFVLPSLKEGFPWIILEAMAANLPIVATNVGAMPEIIRNDYLIEPKNASALAEKINQALLSPAKTELKEKFTAQKMTRQTLEALSKLKLSAEK